MEDVVPKWNRSTVYVWKEPRLALNWHLGDAIHKWNAARVSGQPRLVHTTDRSKAQIIVVTRAYRPDGKIGGWATWEYTDAGYLTAARVTLAWKTPARYRPKLSVHELGHTLGLYHRNSGVTVMRPEVHDMAGSPTALDRRTLGRMY